MTKRKKKPVGDEPRYTAAAVLRSGMCEPWVAKACFKEGETYTLDEIKAIISRFTKGAE